MIPRSVAEGIPYAPDKIMKLAWSNVVVFHNDLVKGPTVVA
jgi:hypothetical protein